LACDSTGTTCATVASGLIGGCPDVLTDGTRAPEESRLVTADRMTVPAVEQTCSRLYAGLRVCCSWPPVAPASKTCHPTPKTRPVPTATGVPDQSGSVVHVARTEQRSTLHGPKSHRAVRIVPLYDPNDDGTSNDTDDDGDDTSKSLNFDDNTAVSVIACVQDRVAYLITVRCAPVTWTAPSSPSFLTTQRLRC
jgi:hypothetical protein